MKIMEDNKPIQYYHIYKITNKINDKCYIGSAVNLTDRWRKHIKTLEGGNHHSIKLQRAWNKYGKDNFIFEIIDATDCKKRLIPDEQYWIDAFSSSSNEGYNICPTAGSQLGFKHSEKTKLRISQVQKGRISNRKGVHLSDETKEKLRKANLGKKLSESTKCKLRGHHFTMSDEGKRKISQASSNKNFYTILLENSKVIEMNDFRHYCSERNIKFARLHAWSKINKENNRIHPKFKMKILNLTVKK